MKFYVPVLIVMLLAACGTLPVPQQASLALLQGDRAAEQQAIEQVLESEEKDLQVAEQSPGSESSAQQQTDVEVTTQVASTEQLDTRAITLTSPSSEDRKTYRTARGYWKHAINLLQNGNEADAVWALEEALKLDPDNRIALKLLQQTQHDPVATLGEQHFQLTLTQGQTLSVVARDYLQDALMFYILARYNNINNPNDVKIGMTIKVPGVQATAEPIIAESSAVVNKDRLAIIKQANKYSRKKQYGLASRLLEEYLETQPEDDTLTEVKTLLVANYVKQVNFFLAVGEHQKAKLVLDKAVDMESNSPVVQRALVRVETVLKVEKLFQNGLAAKQAGDAEKAYEYFNNVLAIDGGHPGANQQIRGMKKKFVPVIYRKALAAQRRQELDEAIALWDELLRLDPQHENARLYRSKALALKTNLQKFAADN